MQNATSLLFAFLVALCQGRSEHFGGFRRRSVTEPAGSSVVPEQQRRSFVTFKSPVPWTSAPVYESSHGQSSSGAASSYGQQSSPSSSFYGGSSSSPSFRGASPSWGSFPRPSSSSASSSPSSPNGLPSFTSSVSPNEASLLPKTITSITFRIPPEAEAGNRATTFTTVIHPTPGTDDNFISRPGYTGKQQNDPGKSITSTSSSTKSVSGGNTSSKPATSEPRNPSTGSSSKSKAQDLSGDKDDKSVGDEGGTEEAASAPAHYTAPAPHRPEYKPSPGYGPSHASPRPTYTASPGAAAAVHQPIPPAQLPFAPQPVAPQSPQQYSHQPPAQYLPPVQPAPYSAPQYQPQPQAHAVPQPPPASAQPAYQPYPSQPAGPTSYRPPPGGAYPPVAQPAPDYAPAYGYPQQPSPYASSPSQPQAPAGPGTHGAPQAGHGYGPARPAQYGPPASSQPPTYAAQTEQRPAYQPVQPPQPPTYAAPEQSYGAPQQQQFTAPGHQQSYNAPQQQPPAAPHPKSQQQPYSSAPQPDQQPYGPPQPQQQSYSPAPTQQRPYSPPQQQQPYNANQQQYAPTQSPKQQYSPPPQKPYGSPERPSAPPAPYGSPPPYESHAAPVPSYGPSPSVSVPAPSYAIPSSPPAPIPSPSPSVQYGGYQGPSAPAQSQQLSNPLPQQRPTYPSPSPYDGAHQPVSGRQPSEPVQLPPDVNLPAQLQHPSQQQQQPPSHNTLPRGPSYSSPPPGPTYSSYPSTSGSGGGSGGGGGAQGEAPFKPVLPAPDASFVPSHYPPVQQTYGQYTPAPYNEGQGYGAPPSLPPSYPGPSSQGGDGEAETKAEANKPPTARPTHSQSYTVGVPSHDPRLPSLFAAQSFGLPSVHSMDSQSHIMNSFGANMLGETATLTQINPALLLAAQNAASLQNSLTPADLLALQNSGLTSGISLSDLLAAQNAGLLGSSTNLAQLLAAQKAGSMSQSLSPAEILAAQNQGMMSSISPAQLMALQNANLMSLLSGSKDSGTSSINPQLLLAAQQSGLASNEFLTKNPALALTLLQGKVPSLSQLSAQNFFQGQKLSLKTNASTETEAQTPSSANLSQLQSLLSAANLAQSQTPAPPSSPHIQAPAASGLPHTPAPTSYSSYYAYAPAPATVPHIQAPAPATVPHIQAPAPANVPHIQAPTPANVPQIQPPTPPKLPEIQAPAPANLPQITGLPGVAPSGAAQKPPISLPPGLAIPSDLTQLSKLIEENPKLAAAFAKENPELALTLLSASPALPSADISGKKPTTPHRVSLPPRQQPIPKTTGDAEGKILKYDFSSDGRGTDSHKFATTNGIQVEEQGNFIPSGLQGLFTPGGAKSGSLVKKGSFSWVSPEGRRFEVRYVADETGFHPEGDHLPTQSKAVQEPGGSPSQSSRSTRGASIEEDTSAEEYSPSDANEWIAISPDDFMSTIPGPSYTDRERSSLPEYEIAPSESIDLEDSSS